MRNKKLLQINTFTKLIYDLIKLKIQKLMSELACTVLHCHCCIKIHGFRPVHFDLHTSPSADELLSYTDTEIQVERQKIGSE